MKWLEVIKLRSAGTDPELLKELLLSIDKSGQTGLLETKAYRHVALKTDMSLHLHWQSERPEFNGSKLGLRIAQSLKEFGLIDHSVWVEKGK